MNPEAWVYRSVIVRAVTGLRPAMIATVDDPTRLDVLCEQLARAERVAELLHRRGFGPRGMDIEEVVAQLLEHEDAD